MPTPTVIRHFKKKAVLFGMEGTYALDPTLVSTDWFEARNVTFTAFDADMQDRPIVKPWMGNGGKLVTAKRHKLSFEVALAASGVMGLPAKIGKFLRACGTAETLNELHGDTAQAGGAASITLAATASAVDDTYNNMSIEITGGTGAGQVNTISAYNGTSKEATVSAWTTPPDATSVYSIRDSVIYTLASSAFESGAFYINIDGILHKGLGVRGTLSGMMDAKGIPLLKVECTSLYTVPVDAAPFVEDRTGWPMELPVNSANTLVCTINAIDSFYSKFNWALGNQVSHNVFGGGYEEIQIGDRQPTASISVLAPLLATFDPYALADAQTNIAVQVVQGVDDGEIVQVDINGEITGVADEEISGLAGYNLTLNPRGVTSDNALTLTFR